MKKILTIIIPSYNISRYIDSIMPHYLCEPLFDKVNLLFIDDGATDNTVELLKPFSKKYPNYIAIINKPNGGHGSVINYGVNIAKTKYFKVVDGDDWVDPKELLRLCEYLDNCDDDLIVSDFMYEFSDRSSLSLGFDEKRQFKYKIHLHNATFKTGIWKANNIKVREKVFYEDSQYVLFPLEFIKKISYFKATIYHYRCDNPNQSVNPMQQLKHKDDYIIVTKDLCDYLMRIWPNQQIDQKIKEYILDNTSRILFGGYEICSSKGLSFSESVKLCKEMDSIFKKYPLVFKQMKKRYKKYRYLSFMNYLGLRIYLKNN